MDVRAPTWESMAALGWIGVVHARGGVDDQAWTIEREPHELALRRDGPAAGAGAHGNMRNQDDTSESQLIAR
jgi:hypothetical protein